jgi:diacylglycerol O-acyltransferase / wax synthase
MCSAMDDEISDDPIPLGPEDRAILALESPTIAGHTCKVARLGGAPLDVDALRARINERIALAPALTRRLGDNANGEPSWVPDADFDVAHHVGPAPVDGPVDRAGLLELVARLFEQRLDRARPLWRIDVVALGDGGSALVWRIHHALADGTASVRYARALLWDHPPDQDGATPAQAAATHAADEVRRRAHLAGFLRREYARGARHSPFDGPIGGRREIAFAAVSLPDLHDATKALCGATVNDGVLAIVTGALARWLRERHGHLGTIRVKVPVSLHHEGDATANHDSFFSLAVSLSETDPVVRLHTIHAATQVRKVDEDARYREHLLRELAAVPSLERFATRLEHSPRTFALNVSNVPGPRTPVSVLQAPVEHLHSIAEIAEHHALRVSATSLAGMLCFGLCADADLIDHLQLMAEGIEAEAQALAGAVQRV